MEDTIEWSNSITEKKLENNQEAMDIQNIGFYLCLSTNSCK